jgi:hypothetical protein
MEVLLFLMNTSVVPQASPDALPALVPSLDPCAPFCRRSTNRESVERYRTGLLTDLERKNCDTIAAAVAGTATERLPPLLTEAAWEPQTLDPQRVTAWVSHRPPYGILVVDDTGLPTQGRASVGVARQYAGTLGKGAHGQGVVSAPSVADEPTSRAPGHWPRTARLYLPVGWATEAARRRKVHVPAEVAWQTQPALALTLGDQARTGGVPCATVVAEAGYGDHPPFLQGLDDRQLPDVVGVRRTFGGRLPTEVQAATLWGPPRPRGRGQPRPAPRYEAPAVLAALPQERWQTLTGRAQDAVVRRTPCVAVRAHWATGGRSARPASTGAPPARQGGCSANVRCQASAARSKGTSATSRRTGPGNDGLNWRIAAGPWSHCTRMPKGRAAWTMTRADAGMVCIAIVPWSGWPLAFARPRWMPADPTGFAPLWGTPLVPSGRVPAS